MAYQSRRAMAARRGQRGSPHPPSNNQQRLYRDLAWLWPIVSPPEDSIEETERLASLLCQHAEGQVNTLLHLGCGGGHNDHTFKRRFAVTGVEVSEAMRRLARRLNPEAAYHLGDMRTARLGQSFDAVVALDAVNYMLSEEDLRAVFATAHAHLNPGGVFLTYAEETRERFQQGKTVGATHRQGEIGVTFVENLHDPEPADTTYEATFVYLVRRRGRLKVETDRHLCGIFPLDTWVRLLMESGFQVKQFEYAPPDRSGYPVFVCRK